LEPNYTVLPFVRQRVSPSPVGEKALLGKTLDTLKAYGQRLRDAFLETVAGSEGIGNFGALSTQPFSGNLGYGYHVAPGLIRIQA